MSHSTNDSAWQHWFEAIWADREERIYPALFGGTGPGIYTIPAPVFTQFGVQNPDPRFLTHGVFECPPTATRPHWLYVTSGMSNPWGDDPATIDPLAPSGLGCEFTLHARDRAAWPIKTLHWVMAVQLLVASGHLQGELLHANDRIPLGGSLGKKDGAITHLLVTSPDAADHAPSPETPLYPADFSLASGSVELLLLIGITAREREFAATQGTEGLTTLLRHRNVFPLTDPERISLV